MNPVFHDISQTLVGRPSSHQGQRPTASLITRLLHELRLSWEQGDGLRIETLLAQNPATADTADAVCRLILEEVSQRRRRGESVDVAEVYARFPQYTETLKALLIPTEQQPLLQNLDIPGERFGQFRLTRELGHGGGGRVYLARQSALADRLVVLKFLSEEVSEHLSLARLQHTNIMPLFGVYEDAP